MTCHCCGGDHSRYRLTISTGRVSLCAACFDRLPQKATWQATIRSYARKV